MQKIKIRSLLIYPCTLAIVVSCDRSAPIDASSGLAIPRADRQAEPKSSSAEIPPTSPQPIEDFWERYDSEYRLLSAEERMDKIRSVVYEAMEGSPAEITDVMDGLSGRVSMLEYRGLCWGLMATLVRSDLQYAKQWIANYEDHPQYSDLFDLFGESVAEFFPEEVAATGLQLHGDGIKFRQYVIGALGSMAKHHGLSEAKSARGILVAAGADQTLVDTAIASNGLRMPEDRELLLDEVVDGHLTPDSSKDIPALLRDWGQFDPSKALSWLVANEDKNLPPETYEKFVVGWAYTDSRSASEWIASLESGPRRDRAVAGLLAHITTTNPDAAFVWAQSIADPKLRERLISPTLKEWAKLDPEAAEDARRLLNPAP